MSRLHPKFTIKPKNYGKKWQRLEVQLLCAMISKGYSLKHCSDVLGRTVNTCLTEFHRAAMCDTTLSRTPYQRRLLRQHENKMAGVSRKIGKTVPLQKCRSFK